MGKRPDTIELEGVMLLPDHEDFCITFEVYYSPGTPGRYSGPPEDCYPDEPAEVELLKAWVTDHSAHRVVEEDFADWEDIYDRLLEKADELYQESRYPEED